MLVLCRKAGQSIMIGDNVKLTIIAIQGSKVRLGIEAPAQVPVHRQEIYDLIQDQKNLSAVNIDS